MRGMIVAALASLAIPLAFISPFLGLLAYCWLSYMRPMDMAWGIGHITFGLYTALALFAGLVFRLRFQFFRWSGVTWILMAFWAWWAVCTYTAYDRSLAGEGLWQISRVFLICLVTTGLCVTKDRLRWVLVATAGSLLFHGTKLGILGVATGGSRNTNAIGGLMSGNNENAIALTMALPFAVHFALNETRRWRRAVLWTVAALTVVAIVCTYSRGGFLGLAATCGVLIWHSRARWFALFVAAPVLVGAGVLFAPDAWKERIGGIDNASASDQSAQFRLMAWRVAADITAEHPIVGIGPENFYSQAKKFDRPSSMHDMEIHNTYLELSSSLGLPGLAGYFVLVGTVWWTLSRTRRELRARGDPRLAWFETVSTATQASMAGFLVASTFGSLANFELMYHVTILGACVPLALRHESDRLADAELAAADAARGAVPAAPMEASPAAPAIVRTRYEQVPCVPAAPPSGLPDFRTAAAAPAAPEPPVPASEPAVRAPDPVVRAPEPAAPASDPRPGQPRRHTAPAGRVEEPVESSHTQLAEMFIDPYGTIGPGDEGFAGRDPDEDRFVDTSTAGPVARGPAERAVRSGLGARPVSSGLGARPVPATPCAAPRPGGGDGPSLRRPPAAWSLPRRA